MEKHDFDIEKIVDQLNIDDEPTGDHKNRLRWQMLKTYNSSNDTSPRVKYKWRTIMQSKITKLTAAAAIILVAMIIVNQFGGSVDLAAPAYAIEQTLEAMQHIETIHLFGKDWGNNEFEMWMQLNPITGIPEYVYADYYTIGALVISRPDKSYQYHKKSNRVQFNSGNLFTIGVAPAKMFEQLLQASKDQNNQEDINIYHESDTETGKTLIVIYYETPKTTMRFYIDPETKLPIRIIGLKNEYVGAIFKDIDLIEYNVELPEGIFDFKIPEDATVVDLDESTKLLDDPKHGLLTEGLSEKEAANTIITKYWNALKAGDVETMNKLTVPQNWYVFSSKQVKEVDEVGKPYVQPGCGIGKVVPCRIRFNDDRLFEIKFIIRFRNINNQPSCVIASKWGGYIEIKE